MMRASVRHIEAVRRADLRDVLVADSERLSHRRTNRCGDACRSPAGRTGSPPLIRSELAARLCCLFVLVRVRQPRSMTPYMLHRVESEDRRSRVLQWDTSVCRAPRMPAASPLGRRIPPQRNQVQWDRVPPNPNTYCGQMQKPHAISAGWLRAAVIQRGRSSRARFGRRPCRDSRGSGPFGR